MKLFSSNSPQIEFDDDDDDDARYQPKPYSLHRSKNQTFQYTHDFQHFDDQNDDVLTLDDDDDANHRTLGENEGFGRYPKRQKLRTSVSNYEFAPRNARSWSEHDKFVLLEVWGERFLQLGRKSLRSEDWAEVADKVSELSGMLRSEAECREMMDSLKRKYRKEKARALGGVSKWGFFNKMDMLMWQENGSGGGSGFGLACGVDSGEFVFMDTRVYLERANGYDEMRDSPCESEDDGYQDDDESEGSEGAKGLRVLADSVQKFGEIYEKIESNKKDQMMELERMRVQFQRELELQKKQLLERAQAEIAKIREWG